MGRRFAVPFDITAVTAAAVLWEIAPAANKPIRLHAIFLQQTSDMGDAAEEGLGILINRKTGAATTGTGTAATPQPIDYLGTAASSAATAKVCMSTNGTGGTTTLVHAEGMNTRGGYERIFPPEEQFQFVASTGATTVGLEVKLSAAPADSLSFIGTLWFDEEN